jgi:hypothetical protein
VELSLYTTELDSATDGMLIVHDALRAYPALNKFNYVRKVQPLGAPKETVGPSLDFYDLIKKKEALIFTDAIIASMEGNDVLTFPRLTYLERFVVGSKPEDLVHTD